MKAQILLIGLLASCVLGLNVYEDSYEKYIGDNGCQNRIAMNSKYVNWDKNYLCNGDFKQPEIPANKNRMAFQVMPCWKGDGNFELISGNTSDNKPFQLIDLNHKKSANFIKQTVDLYEGKFQLKFEYYVSDQKPLEDAGLDVYFNGVQSAKVRPLSYGFSTVVTTLNGRHGPNSLEFVELQPRKKSNSKTDKDDSYVDWKDNKIVNGDFEKAELPQNKQQHEFKNFLPWKGTEKMVIGYCSQYTDKMTTKCLELDSRKNGQDVIQAVQLTKGKYEIKFDTAPTKAKSPEESSFDVFFNNKKVLKVKPTSHDMQTYKITVDAKDGKNQLKFSDKGCKNLVGAAIDNVGIYPYKVLAKGQIQCPKGLGLANVGLYEWKENCFFKKKSKVSTTEAVKEIEAVGAGFPVQYSSTVAGQRYSSYQLDAKVSGVYQGWCPLQQSELYNWIQVSATEPKKWNKVIIQGRGDSSYRVTLFSLKYTVDGFNWVDYKNGKKFSGAIDRTTKVVHQLEPFYALTVRLVVLGHYGRTCLRWGATFIEEE